MRLTLTKGKHPIPAMHIEVQVALNFVISYLYNKLPRRRVNIFGEELEKALKEKFRGHWYPDRPCRGSAFRCLKTGGPLDPVLERAARESGVPVRDVLEHLPRDLAVWVDPGKVQISKAYSRLSIIIIIIISTPITGRRTKGHGPPPTIRRV
ncbi:jg21140 [Pararge aegeria aegeria]|uniref:Jg21140 protein n=1 Tax=Pararge aegeria aegeria TaxID=348720 RepID=A0A8S4SHC0_9NEOP|nr:jg21140 [Pararge aegeria aegeria]